MVCAEPSVWWAVRGAWCPAPGGQGPHKCTRLLQVPLGLGTKPEEKLHFRELLCGFASALVFYLFWQFEYCLNIKVIQNQGTLQEETTETTPDKYCIGSLGICELKATKHTTASGRLCCCLDERNQALTVESVWK